MASELMKAQEQLSAVEFSADGALQLRTLGEAFCVARLLIGAGFAPKGSTPESATVAIMQGKKLGLDALTSVQGIAAVNGRPTLWGDAMVAVVQASGLMEDEKVEWIPSHKDPQAVRYTVKRKGRPTPYVGEYSRLMAERAGLSNNYVGALERGEKRPSLSCFIKLVNALEVSADMLLTDLTQSDYKGRESALAEELADLSGPERQEICDVIEVMIRHAKQRKQ